MINEENLDTNTQEPSAYQPENIDPSLLQQVEGSEITTQVTNPAIKSVTQVPNSAVAATELPTANISPRKPHRDRKISLIVVASLLVLAASGLAVFYFVIRTPNNEYDAAVKSLQTMKASADAIHGKKINSTMSADSQKTVSDTIKKDFTNYVAFWRGVSVEE